MFLATLVILPLSGSAQPHGAERTVLRVGHQVTYVNLNAWVIDVADFPERWEIKYVFQDVPVLGIRMVYELKAV